MRRDFSDSVISKIDKDRRSGAAKARDARVTSDARMATAVSLLVFPNTAAGIINSGAAGGSFSVAQNKSAYFIKTDAENWIAILSA